MENARTPLRGQAPRLAARLLAASVAISAAATSATATAQQPPEPVQQIARAFLEQSTRGLPGEVSIDLGKLDANNQLPPCSALSAFLPAQARAWGQINVGVRCDSPVVWSVYLPARVSVTADYLVNARALRAGQIVGPADIGRKRGDLASLPDDTLTDPAQAQGYHTRHALAAGNALRASMLRIPDAVRQGQNVQVISTGEGFSVASEGRAMNNAAPGDAVRVRMPNGQVVNGTARTDGTVEIPF